MQPSPSTRAEARLLLLAALAAILSSASARAAGLVAPTPEQAVCCDVNSSAIVDVLDALLMAQAAAGLGVTLTCP